MATKGLFSSMLNQSPVKAPRVTGSSVKVQNPPGSGEFAYMPEGNSIYKHPLQRRGQDVAPSLWARMLNRKRSS